MTNLVPVSKPGLAVPNFAAGSVPKHIALVMDGNGRWANQRGLTRVEGHRAGEAALLDVVAGAIEAGVSYLTVYAFSTENWKRSPEEVKFLMGFNREVLRARRDQLNAWGVRIRWAGRRPRLWGSVISELEAAEKLTMGNSRLVLTMCVNYGGQVELLDAINSLSVDVAEGKIKPGRISEKQLLKHLNSGFLPPVDLFLRSSGEQRTSNFLPWQSAYAEFIFDDTLWPDYDRQTLWRAIAKFGTRSRRFGGAEDKPSAKPLG
jgi:undecaprenyl diphosphate synthase